MDVIWIVVADGSRAEIVASVKGVEGVTSVREFDNASGRARAADLVSDRAGRCEKHGGAVRSTMDADTDPHEYALRRFAHEINHALDAANYRHAYDRLILIAPPHFLGLLKSAMRPGPKARLAASLANDLTRFDLDSVADRVKDSVRLARAIVAAR